MKRNAFAPIGSQWLHALATISLLVACNSSPPPLGSGSGNAGSGGNGNGTVTVKLDGSASGNGGSGGTVPLGDGSVSLSGDATCGSATSSMNQQPADLLLVLDRSGSMNSAIDSDQNCSGSTGCVSRWTDVTKALQQTLGAGLSGVRWGLKLFGSLTSQSGSDTNWGCVVDNTIEVPVGDNTAATIQSTVSGARTGSATPTRAAVEAATTYLKGLKDSYPRYILLATDGQPNCPAGSTTANYDTNDLDPTVQAIATAAKADIKTFVVGISTTPGNLTKMAAAGGTNDYYSATSPDALTKALQTIAGQVASCTFTMGSTPPDPNNVGVYLDNAIVPNSSGDGWSYGSNTSTVVFNGSYCDGIKNNTYKTVKVWFGCPGGAPPPSIIN